LTFLAYAVEPQKWIRIYDTITLLISVHLVAAIIKQHFTIVHMCRPYIPLKQLLRFVQSPEWVEV